MSPHNKKVESCCRKHTTRAPHNVCVVSEQQEETKKKPPNKNTCTNACCRTGVTHHAPCMHPPRTPHSITVLTPVALRTAPAPASMEAVASGGDG